MKTPDLTCITWNEPVSDDPTSKSVSPRKPRGWGLVAAGFLLFALALVVIYTSRPAFSSPIAIVVVAAIGLAALLLELRLRRDARRIRAPLWLNVLGVLFALAAVFADVLRLSVNNLLIACLGAVICFAISGIMVLHALRKRRD